MLIRTCKVCGEAIPHEKFDVAYERKLYCSEICKYFANLIQSIHKAREKNPKLAKGVLRYVLAELFYDP